MKARTLLLWCGVLVTTALVADCLIGDYFLRAPVGAFIYLPVAFALTWGAFVGARCLWLTKRARRPITFRSGAIEVAVQVGLLLLSVACIIGVPYAYGQANYQLYHRDPIGVGNDVDRPPCATHELARRGNGHGVVASVREAECWGNWDPILMYFVFVHRAGEPNTHENLVFRYEYYSTAPPPTVLWTGGSNLRIDAHGDILEITKQRVRVGNVSIWYRVRIDQSTFSEQ